MAVLSERDHLFKWSATEKRTYTNFRAIPPTVVPRLGDHFYIFIPEHILKYYKARVAVIPTREAHCLRREAWCGWCH